MTSRSATSHKRTSSKTTARKSPSRQPSARPTSGKAMSGKAMSGKPVARKATTRKPATRKAMAGGSRRRAASADPASARKGSRPGTERARDEQRDAPTPRYGGGPWSVADERGDARFGHARNDDADPSELAPHEANNDDDESPSAADPELAAAEAAGEIESGGERAGMRRGERPRKNKSREP